MNRADEAAELIEMVLEDVVAEEKGFEIVMRIGHGRHGQKILVGVFENLVGTYIPGVGNELKLPIALALIITVLVVKPAGLFGRPVVKRV